MSKLPIVAAALAFSAAVAAPAVAKGKRTTSTVRTIVVYSGHVTSKNAHLLTEIISNSTDRVIGLKLSIDPSAEQDRRYSSSLSENQIIISTGDPTDAPTEVLINDGVGTTAAGGIYTADGFYLIKSGGTHAAGAASYGAMPVPEASIRLNPRVRLVTKRL